MEPILLEVEAIATGRIEEPGRPRGEEVVDVAHGELVVALAVVLQREEVRGVEVVAVPLDCASVLKKFSDTSSSG